MGRTLEIEIAYKFLGRQAGYLAKRRILQKTIINYSLLIYST
jgi:hypothetical protein